MTYRTTLILLLVTLLSVAACSGDDDASPAPGAGAGGTVTAGGQTQDSEPTVTCQDGQQAPCDCGGGVTGFATCQAGLFGACTGCEGQQAPCLGCVAATGACVPYAAQSVAACGRDGRVCSTCGEGFACASGACVVDSGTCSVASCPSGCCSGNVCFQPNDQSSRACGSGGGACETCPTGGSCLSGGVCSDAIDPFAFFQLEVLSMSSRERSSQTGETFDLLGGLPDLVACVYVGDAVGCTSPCQDSTSCVPVLPNTDVLLIGDALLQGSVTVAVWDVDDFDSFDYVGATTVQFSRVITAPLDLGPFDDVTALTLRLVPVGF